jgi:hypothetical protein
VHAWQECASFILSQSKEMNLFSMHLQGNWLFYVPAFTFLARFPKLTCNITYCFIKIYLLIKKYPQNSVYIL